MFNPVIIILCVMRGVMIWTEMEAGKLRYETAEKGDEIIYTDGSVHC